MMGHFLDPWPQWVGLAFLTALRERMRQPGGEAVVGPYLRWLVRLIGTDIDQSLRIEAIHDGGDIIVIDTFFSQSHYGLPARRQVEIAKFAHNRLLAMETQRRAAGWNGNLPATIP